MANLAFRSFTTLGYFSAVLLIAIVAVLALTSFGDDSNGQPALGTATPAPTRVTVGPDGDVSSIAEGIDAAGAGGIAEVHAGVYDEFVGITEAATILSAGDLEMAGNETPDRPLALD